MQNCRREYSRIEVVWPVTIFTAVGLIEGHLKNISLGGALINCKSLPDLEGTFNVTIEIPNYLFPVAARAKQVRLNIFDSDDQNLSPSYDLAVRFVDMLEDDRKVFHQAIERAFRTKRKGFIAKKAVTRKSARIDDNLLMTVEKLSLDSGRSFKELLEEALRDLIHKYEKTIPIEDQSLQL
jgi:hypothetical protein